MIGSAGPRRAEEALLFLAEASKQLAASLDYQITLANVAHLAVPRSPTGEVIFEPFGRAANVGQRQVRGLGLGLYICRMLVERHRGRIWAESAGEGLGTTNERLAAR